MIEASRVLARLVRNGSLTPWEAEQVEADPELLELWRGTFAWSWARLGTAIEELNERVKEAWRKGMSRR